VAITLVVVLLVLSENVGLSSEYASENLAVLQFKESFGRFFLEGLVRA